MYKKWIHRLLLVAITGCSVSSSGQVIDNTSTFKTINNKSYFRFQYDNDFFTKEDRYYSQGISFEYVHPGIRKFLVSKILLRPKNSNSVYGVGLNVFGYTPTSILSSDILYGDRPYAGAITLKTFSSATHTLKKKRLSTAFNLGILGPSAFGKQIQVNIHSWLNNPSPKGWYTQIQNSVIVNYEVNYEKQLLASSGYFLFNGIANFRLGTLNTRLSGGFNLMAGNFNDPFKSAEFKRRKVAYYFYAQARSHLVGYDASMQGGIFSKSDPYVIGANDIERLTFQADAGIVVNFPKLYLSYSQSFLSREFRTGQHHRWGGLNMGFGF